MTQERVDILDYIIDDLRGTCKVLDAVAEEYGIEELTLEDLEYIENWIFLCINCGWWCDRGEEVMDGTCQDCYDEEYGEEDWEDE